MQLEWHTVDLSIRIESMLQYLQRYFLQAARWVCSIGWSGKEDF